MARYGLGLALVLLQGCSFLFVDGPPDGHEKLRYFDCSSSAAAPVTDATLAAVELLVAIALADTDPGERSPTSGVVFFGALATTHAASAIYGAFSARSCSSAKQQLAERIHRGDAATKQVIEELQRQLAEQLERERNETPPSPAVDPASSAPNVPPAEPTEPLPATPATPPEGAPTL